MKKIILLSFILLCLTGCTGYTELENLAYVSSIGIDYQDDNYILSYEVLNNKKQQDTIKEEAYVINGHGKTLTEAMQNASEKLSKKPFFDHAQIVVLSNSFLEKGLEPLTDFVLRNTQIRNSFYLYSAPNAEEILKCSNEENPIVANKLKNMMEINSYSNVLLQKINYDEFINNIENYHQDNTIAELNIKNDNIEITGINILQGYKAVDFLNIDESNLISFLTRKNSFIFATKYYDNNPVNLKITLKKKNITFDKDNININLEMKAIVIDNAPKIDLLNSDNYNMLSDDFKSIMEEKITHIINLLQQNNSDLLGIKYKYYLNTRNDLKNAWAKEKINITTKIDINKKGIIYDTGQNN
jgi:spore germination protein KC